MIRAKQVTVSTTATLLAPLTTDTSANGCTVWVTVGATDIWIHGANDLLTDGTKGRKVVASKDFTISLEWGESLYGKTASSTSTCDVLEQGTS